MKKLFLLIGLVVMLCAVYFFATQRQSFIPTSDLFSQHSNVKVVKFGAIGLVETGEGQYLTDPEGHTLYVDTKDQNRKLNGPLACNSTCEQTWLPYLFGADSIRLSPSRDPFLSRLNIITRPDGQKQYALGSEPLYFYSLDTQIGDVKGDNLETWQVARP